MKAALRLTGEGIVRALGGALPAVDAAARARAEALARELEEEGREVWVLRRGAGDYAVEAEAPSLETPPDVMPASGRASSSRQRLRANN
jgi:hypothetical protein